MSMTYAQAVVHRMEDEESFEVVINDRTVCDVTPSGHIKDTQDELCVVLCATVRGGLHVRRNVDGAEVIWQWSAIGSLRFIL